MGPIRSGVSRSATFQLPPVGKPLSPNEMEDIGKAKLGNPLFEYRRFDISDKDGSISAVASQNFSSQIDVVAHNQRNIQILDTAIKLLQKGKLNKAEKGFAKTAKKIAKSSFKGDPSNLVQGLSALRAGLSKQIIYMKKEAVSQTLREWGQKYPLPNSEEIQSAFANIAENKGHKSDGMDIFRHVQSGCVLLEDQLGNDLFSLNEVANHDVSEEKSDELRGESFAIRLQLILETFRDIIAKSDPGASKVIDEEIKKLTDTVRGNADVAGERVQDAVDEWRESESKELNHFARMVYPLNQSFYMGPLDRILLALKSDLGQDNSPAALSGLGGKIFKFDRASRKIHFKEKPEGGLEVQHLVTVREYENGKENLKPTTTRVDILVKLSTESNQLEKWGHNTQFEVDATQVEDFGTAETIRKILRDLDYTS